MTRDRKLKLKKVMSMTLATALITSNLSYASTVSTRANINIKNIIGKNRYDTSVKIAQQIYSSTKATNVIIVNGSAIADGLTATPLASITEAPILLTARDSLPKEIKDELKILNPKNVTIIGGEGVISQKVVENIKEILPDIKIDRIGGKDRYETSLKIAQAIDARNDVKKVYIGYGYGEPDALSIAAKAGEDKQPIILSQKESLHKDTYEWLKKEELETAYFIGGDAKLKDSVINEVNSITKSDIKLNRIAGKDRHETNAKVIEKFYTSDKLNSALVTKSNEMVDVLTAGPLASQLKSPIILASQGELSENQKNVLDKKSTETVYRVGGGISDAVFKDIVLKLTPSQKPSTGGGTGSGGGSKPEPPVNPDDDLLNPDNPKWDIDSDKDGLMDAEEETIGTNANKADTDGDGLNDKFELESGLDATKRDSDDNGTLDSNEDLDKDGLTNLQEQQYKTNPVFEDTDGDELIDGDEVNKYKTNPNLSDTDSDKLDDNVELKLGTNQNNKDSNSNGINDGDEKYNTDIQTRGSELDENIEITVSGNIKGEYIESIYTTNMEATHSFIKKDMPGYIGAPFRVSVGEDGVTQNIELTFKINNNKLKEIGNKEIGLYEYDEKEDELKLVTENVARTRSNEIKAKVSINDYKEYVLLISEEWNEAWHQELLKPNATKKDLDVVLAIDSSGSMQGNDENDIRKSESKKFVDKLEANNRAAIVDFDSYASVKQELTTDKEALKSAIDTIDSSGGTNISRAIQTSVRLIDFNARDDKYSTENSDEGLTIGEKEQYNEDNKVEDEVFMSGVNNDDKLKTIVLLTDGQSSVSENDTYLKYAAENDIKIFTAGLGKSVSESTLRMIASKTGAKYLHAMNADDLVELFDELIEQTIDLTTDSDKDGIPNYFERNLRIKNGAILQLDPNNPDTDGDGLSDGYEITGHDDPTPKQFRAMYVDADKPYFKIISRPDVKDTDGDGQEDGNGGDITNGSGNNVNDKEPTVYKVHDGTLLKFAQLSYERLYKSYEDNPVSIIPSELGSDKYQINVSRDDIDKWDIVRVNNGPFGIIQKGGFGAIAVKQDKNMIIAFTGTDLLDKDDLLADISIAIGTNQQVRQAKAFINNALKNNKDIENIFVTGHSLGGYLSQHGAYNLLNGKIKNAENVENIKAVTFSSPQLMNPLHLDGIPSPPIPETNQHWNKINKPIYNDNVNNYFVKKDPIAFLGTLNLGTTYAGFDDLVPEDDAWYKLNFDKHSIYNFYKYNKFQY